MDLSIIILNYNVRYLLDGCLQSVLDAIDSLDAEVIVIDNASKDDSVPMVRDQYPMVRLVCLNENIGFSRAYNQVVPSCNGDFILLLNPDTIVNKSALTSSLHHARLASVGAVGVAMYNGEGSYLPESKRGFPDTLTSLYKLTGLYRLFPSNHHINRYYLGHLDPNKDQEVDILTGAFLMMSKKIYQEIGGLDESFYLYGEDIDLSHRIKQTGKKIIYLGSEKIVHLKGRSARQDSWSQVSIFYDAMSVFVKKYQKNKLGLVFTLCSIKVARAIAYFRRKVFVHSLPLMDLLVIGSTLVCVPLVWGKLWFGQLYYFNHQVYVFNALGYGIVWMLSLILSGAYRKSVFRPEFKAVKAVSAGTLFILVVYSLFPESWRSSRAIILLSGALLVLLLPLVRKIISTTYAGLRVIYLSSVSSLEKNNQLFKDLAKSSLLAFSKHLDASQPLPKDLLNHAVRELGIDAFILDGTDVSINDHLTHLAQIQRHTPFYFLHDQYPSSFFNNEIFGLSDARIRLYHPINKWIKIISNLILCALLLPWAWLKKDVRKHFFQLVSGSMYWVGYKEPMDPLLPFRKPGLYTMSSLQNVAGTVYELNYLYARYQSLALDLTIIWRQFFNI